MKLQTLRLVNFQDHYDTTLAFGNTFTCIVGATNSGKSSLARALTFLFYGDWIDDYISHGTKETTVIASFDTGISITRIKGAKENTLILTKGEEVHRFEKIGRALPAEFYQILQLSPVLLDTDQELYLNIANQDEPYFLLAETGPTKTKLLGKLAGLHVADAAMRSLSTDRKNLSSEKQYIKELLEQSENQAVQYANLPKYTAIAENAQTLLEMVQATSSRLTRLLELQAQLKIWMQRRQIIDKIKVRAVLPDLGSIREKYEQITCLQKLRTTYQHCLKERTQLLYLKEEYQDKYEENKRKYEKLLASCPQCPTCRTPLTADVIAGAISNL